MTCAICCVKFSNTYKVKEEEALMNEGQASGKHGFFYYLFCCCLCSCFFKSKNDNQQMHAANEDEDENELAELAAAKDKEED